MTGTEWRFCFHESSASLWKGLGLHVARSEAHEHREGRGDFGGNIDTEHPGDPDEDDGEGTCDASGYDLGLWIQSDLLGSHQGSETVK